MQYGSDGVQYGPFASHQECRAKVDQLLDTPTPDPPSEPTPEPEPEPNPWDLIETYRVYNLWLYQTQDEYWGYYAVYESVSYGPYDSLQECRAKVDQLLDTPMPDPFPDPTPDDGDEPISTPNIVQAIIGFTITVLGLFMQFGAGLDKNLGAILKGG